MTTSGQPAQQNNQSGQQSPEERTEQAMLRMASDMREQGHVHEAMQMYMNLLEQYPSDQATEDAKNGLIDLAQYLEQQGMTRTALEIYQRLEQFG